MNKDFNRYYQQIRGKQKREALIWSGIMLILYLWSGNVSELNLKTIIVSAPSFLDYIRETVPVLHWSLLFADGHTEGSFAYWGYRLNIQLPLIWETIQLALSSTILSTALAVLLAFLAANNTDSPKWLKFSIRTFVAFLRTMPELAWAVMCVMAFGVGAIPGFIALTLHTVGSLTKLFYESIETASDKPVRGLRACGAGRLQRMRFAMWPQVKPIFLSYSFMRLEINFRQSTILGLVGAGGIGLILNEKIGWREYPSVGIILLALFVTVFIIETISREIRRHLT